MPTIDVSDEQYAFLRALREELQSEVQYGSVREQDALQYLIDHFEGGADLDVDADVEVDADAVGGDDASADGGAVAASADAAPGGTAPTVDDAGSADADSSGASDGSTSGGSTSGGGTSGGPTPDPEGDGDDRLNAMMNLLDTHEDKWREASQGDARYEVDMPDGSTEYVQTKDDVRAHIFKNYD